VIWRHLQAQQGIACEVVAPSSIPAKTLHRPGEDRSARRQP
jgi:hypothetical protein